MGNPVMPCKREPFPQGKQQKIKIGNDIHQSTHGYIETGAKAAGPGSGKKPYEKMAKKSIVPVAGNALIGSFSPMPATLTLALVQA
jgi:hypothetical protein